MVVVQRAVDVEWTGSIARGSGCASGGSGALGDLPITVASRFGEPDGKTSPEELIAAAHAAACFAMALGSIQAAQEAERRCPVSRALQENVAIGVYATLEGPPASSGSAKHEHEGRG